MATSTPPIDSALPKLSQALCEHSGAVLVAEPGAGKTTRVPLFLLDAPWLNGLRILMLEPRRIAARSAARYMASRLGEQVGETVGYRVRGETRSGRSTRIEVVTEGVLTRMLQADPSLDGVGLVIFDEFHERSLHADLGLALCLESQEILRPDLRLLVMSATIEAEPVARLMNDAPIIASEGRTFPVATRYLNFRSDGRIETAVARAVRIALEETDGDMLVFLPGVREIRKVAESLRNLELSGVEIAPLHGGLTHEAQDKAISTSPVGARRVVLSTSIAETSLTVEGVTVVIDSGLTRVSRFSPRTGMSRLETVRVSRASADQRRGRAGRLGPGVCYRLWSQQDDVHLSPQHAPEILEADLAPLALELALWGALGAYDLRWLNPPPEAALSQARELLGQLGAVDDKGGITGRGRRIAELGIHPRLGRMVLEAVLLGAVKTACALAALLEERDIFRGEKGAPDPDMRLRVEAVLGDLGLSARGGEAYGYIVDRDAVRRTQVEARRLMARVRDVVGDVKANPDQKGAASNLTASNQDASDLCGLLLAFAFPDRVAQRRSSGRFLLRNGRGAAFPGVHPLAEEAYVVAVELDDKGADSRILLAAPVCVSDLERHFGHEIMTEEIVEWDSEGRRVAARRKARLGALVLRDEPLSAPDPSQALDALIQGIRQEGLGILPWSTGARSLQQRLVFMRQFDSDVPDVSDASLVDNIGEWLAPHLYGITKASELQRLDLRAILQEILTWDQRRELDEFAPTHFETPGGARVQIDYSDPGAPTIAVRLQAMFGLKETPRIARGRTPLRLQLLSPASRPIQVTQDLASFWSGAYFEVRKELKGRYPKHYWPDDPLEAEPRQLKGR